MSKKRVRATVVAAVVVVAVVVMGRMVRAANPIFNNDFTADVIVVGIWPFPGYGLANFGPGFPGKTEGDLFNDQTGQRSRFAFPNYAAANRLDIFNFYDEHRSYSVRPDLNQCVKRALVTEMPDYFDWVASATKQSTPCLQFLNSGKSGTQWDLVQTLPNGRQEVRSLCTSSADEKVPYWISWGRGDQTIVMEFKTYNAGRPPASVLTLPASCTN